MFRVLLAGAKNHASGRQCWAGGLAALIRPMLSKRSDGTLAMCEFRADTRAQKGEERDEQQRQPGD